MDAEDRAPGEFKIKQGVCRQLQIGGGCGRIPWPIEDIGAALRSRRRSVPSGYGFKIVIHGLGLLSHVFSMATRWRVVGSNPHVEES